VHAFEPLAESYQILGERALRDPKIKPIRCAVSDSAGVATFYTTQSKESNSLLRPRQTGRRLDGLHQFKEELQIETTTIDQYCEANRIRKINILKLDIQGGELAALKGAIGLLAAQGIDIIVLEAEFAELYSEQPLFCDVLSFLAGFEYALYSIPKQVHDDIGQLLWVDAIFCSANVLKKLQTRFQI
jgi:FkbM family methyltransferase